MPVIAFERADDKRRSGFDVYVDGGLVATIQYNDRLEHTVPAGEHTVAVKYMGEGGKELLVAVGEGETRRFRINISERSQYSYRWVLRLGLFMTFAASFQHWTLAVWLGIAAVATLIYTAAVQRPKLFELTELPGTAEGSEEVE